MGRAYEVRKASIQKTGAVKAKLYSMYAKEIYMAAKNGGSEADTNISLKRIIDKAKKEQIPSDIIKRAIDKANSGISEAYEPVRYEIFGPNGSTVLVDCLTDNVNRSISLIRAALNKTKCKLGVSGSASFMYENLCVVGFKYNNEEKVLEFLLTDDITPIDIEKENEEIIIYAEPKDLYIIKECVIKNLGNITFEIDEITMIPKSKVNLMGEDLEDFEKLLNLLDDIEDVVKVYHNVDLEN